MRRVIVAIACMTVLALGAWALVGVRAQIPFAFEAGDRVMPAGEYRIDRILAGGGILVTNLDGESVPLITIPSGNPNEAANPKLVFMKSGNTYWLHEVTFPGAVTGAKVPETKAQRMLIAKSGQKAQRVEVALVRH